MLNRSNRPARGTYTVTDGALVPVVEPSADASGARLRPGRVVQTPSGDFVTSPEPLSSLTASARRLTSRKMREARSGAGGGSRASGWQDDAWDMYDLVGEQRYLASTLASQMSKARLYVGRLPEDPIDAPEPVEDERLIGLLDSFGRTAAGRAQIIQRLGVNLYIAGAGWVVGLPSDDEGGDEGNVDPSDLDWATYSVSEVSIGQDKVTLALDSNEKREVSPDEVILIEVWRPHPRRAWEADSPTRSSLPVLRELVGLTMHISAQVDSRLAGAGLLIVPESASRAIKVASGLGEGDTEDPFTDALIEAMVTPISDRASASALVPLTVTVPDESASLFRHLTFSQALDTEARSLRDEAIRRLALGQDAPPELLLGTAGMNHWGAWLVREDVVVTHLEPPLALICDALTTQYLWPLMDDLGYSEEEIHQHVIWYDVEHLIVRPNRGSDAAALHSAGVLSDTALRGAMGFDESDAPEQAAKTDPAVEQALALVSNAPSLAQAPGIPALVEQIRAVLSGSTAPATEEEPAPDAPTDETSGAVPSTDGDRATAIEEDM